MFGKNKKPKTKAATVPNEEEVEEEEPQEQGVPFPSQEGKPTVTDYLQNHEERIRNLEAFASRVKSA